MTQKIKRTNKLIKSYNMLINQKTQFCCDSNSPQIHLVIQCDPTKIPASFSVDISILDLTFRCKSNELAIAKIILKTKNKLEHFIILF